MDAFLRDHSCYIVWDFIHPLFQTFDINHHDIDFSSVIQNIPFSNVHILIKNLLLSSWTKFLLSYAPNNQCSNYIKIIYFAKSL